ncbi:MAG: YaiI/YqxD family protein [Proteobacteria bacterium]|nr:YaiI/YqxD family protein [Pseudomonadota bacterium]
MTAIYIDADACPVREEVLRVAARRQLAVHIVSNGSRPIRPPAQVDVHMVVVPPEPDAADDWIAQHIGPADICVTADIPLASRCLGAGARAVAPDGHVWTEANIGAALAGREVSRHLRELGLSAGGGKALSKQDRSAFLNALDALVTAAQRTRAALNFRPPPEAE